MAMALSRANKKPTKPEDTTKPLADVLLVIIAIFIPPLAVFLYEGSITTNFWINLLLTFCFLLPGVIHALLLLHGVI